MGLFQFICFVDVLQLVVFKKIGLAKLSIVGLKVIQSTLRELEIKRQVEME